MGARLPHGPCPGPVSVRAGKDPSHQRSSLKLLARYPDRSHQLAGAVTIISDNGPQFIARDFKDYIRVSGMTHVRISPGYPQSNGKIERWHRTLKNDTVRLRTPESLEEARELVTRFVDHYNAVRLHSALGYVAPADFLAGKAAHIHAERDRKLERARELRRQKRAEKRAQQAA